MSRGPGAVAISHGSTFLVAGVEGSIQSREGGEPGLYSDDTRFISGHDLRINGRALESISYSQLSSRHARWHLIAPAMVDLDGRPIDATIAVTIDRLLSARRMHEDISVRAWGRGPLAFLLTVSLSTDFADFFEMRFRRWQRRPQLATVWQPPHRLETIYRRQDFIRRCLIRVRPDFVGAGYANGSLRFPIDLTPEGEWKVCLQYDLISSIKSHPVLAASCPLVGNVSDRSEQLHRRWHATAARIQSADLRLLSAYEEAIEDFAALRLYDHDFSKDVWVPAAGIPWFVAVFGRDSIIASLQALPIHPLLAIGTLQKLAAWQATTDDPVRDAEPGKICHEKRVGEWAHFGTVPHTPYYGTADATPLYLMLLGETYRWLGDAEMLLPFQNAAIRCLDWIDRYGDRDGDGFQEYAPRTPTGYRNQCWRDAEDGVLDEWGQFPPHPIATCEMQGYVYAAKMSVANLFRAWGDTERADRLEREARDLCERFLDAYWLPESNTLAFALDGNKRRVSTVTSNPGHCLWTGILDPQRGHAVADRLLNPDLFTGWGLRTLSSAHPAYSPHSYQRGSVWPHDTMITAAGLRRYGRTADAWRLIDGVLSAAVSFQRAQLPELFAGLQRRPHDVPVPYLKASSPQAWAAGAAFQAVRILLSLEPDVPNGKIYVDPALPTWCPRLELNNVRAGSSRLHIAAWRHRNGTSDVSVEVHGPQRFDIVHGPAPWMKPADPA